MSTVTRPYLGAKSRPRAKNRKPSPAAQDRRPTASTPRTFPTPHRVELAALAESMRAIGVYLGDRLTLGAEVRDGGAAGLLVFSGGPGGEQHQALERVDIEGAITAWLAYATAGGAIVTRAIVATNLLFLVQETDAQIAVARVAGRPAPELVPLEARLVLLAGVRDAVEGGGA